jgi:hypothetical protein
MRYLDRQRGRLVYRQGRRALTKRVAGRSTSSRFVRQERRTQFQAGRPTDRQTDVPID